MTGGREWVGKGLQRVPSRPRARCVGTQDEWAAACGSVTRLLR
jgi:hypothetical protein